MTFPVTKHETLPEEGEKRLYNLLFLSHLQWRIRSPPLFLDQTDRASPLSQGVDDRPPPPYLNVWIRH